jgi:hypothetical protein
MAYRDFPDGNFFGDPSIDFSVLPDYIADEYYVQVTGLSEVLIDYYVEAEDSLGHIKRSPIQHVWIGEAGGSASHAIDGSLDSASTLVATGDLTLYADWDGEYLYVAAEGVGATGSWDHFIIIGTDLATPVTAPWAKAGSVADRTLYLGNEDSNNWCGWFDGTEAVVTTDVDCASGAYLEGIVRLETYLGLPLPDGVYLAVAGYQSPDGGSLQAQAPAGNADGNIDEPEYVWYPLSTSGIDRPVPGDETATLSAGPNPFSTHTRIDLYLARPAAISLIVYDLTGREVRTLADGARGEGVHNFTWDGTNTGGSRVSPGIYLISLKHSGRSQAHKVVLTQ